MFIPLTFWPTVVAVIVITTATTTTTEVGIKLQVGINSVNTLMPTTYIHELPFFPYLLYLFYIAISELRFTLKYLSLHLLRIVTFS